MEFVKIGRHYINLEQVTSVEQFVKEYETIPSEPAIRVCFQTGNIVLVGVDMDAMVRWLDRIAVVLKPGGGWTQERDHHD